MKRPHAITEALRQLRMAARRRLGRSQPEHELIRDSGDYWNGSTPAGVDLKDYSHWQGAGPWKDSERWLALGRPHLELYEKLLRLTATARRPVRILEWGCGGGANAVHFFPLASEFSGIEISQASLDECRRVLHLAGFDAFRGTLIDAAQPESALRLAGDGYDFFLSTYVFELIPGKKYGERILRTAHAMLQPGALGLIQIRYDDGSERSSQKSIDYFRDCTRFTSYRVEEFWLLLERVGFLPEFVWLAPHQTNEFSGDLYAYFTIRKPEPDGSACPAVAANGVSADG
jgi:SAM-dependent methyltransferase